MVGCYSNDNHELIVISTFDHPHTVRLPVLATSCLVKHISSARNAVSCPKGLPLGLCFGMSLSRFVISCGLGVSLSPAACVTDEEGNHG